LCALPGASLRCGNTAAIESRRLCFSCRGSSQFDPQQTSTTRRPRLRLKTQHLRVDARDQSLRTRHGGCEAIRSIQCRTSFLQGCDLLRETSTLIGPVPRHDPLLHYSGAAVMRVQAALALLPRSCISQSKAMPEPPPCRTRTSASAPNVAFTAAVNVQGGNFTRKSRVQPKKILITSAKRLLQQKSALREHAHHLWDKRAVSSSFEVTQGQRHDDET
jgi:hypothetical protein